MIRVWLEQFNYTGRQPRPDIAVESSPEGDGMVLMHLELEGPDELAGQTLKAPSFEGYRDELERILAGTQPGMSHARILLAREVERLQSLIESQHQVSRQLVPGEARELAAALIHYAGEAEARRA